MKIAKINAATVARWVHPTGCAVLYLKDGTIRRRGRRGPYLTVQEGATITDAEAYVATLDGYRRTATDANKMQNDCREKRQIDSTRQLITAELTDADRTEIAAWHQDRERRIRNYQRAAKIQSKRLGIACNHTRSPL